MDILFVCTGNICRSPMAEALLRRRLLDVGELPRVHSAGLLGAGRVPPQEAVTALAPHELDIGPHRSRTLVADMLAESDLVIGMAREHVQEAILLHPPAWPRTFTLKELVRRAEQVGARSAGQPFDEWVEKLHAGRNRADLLGSSPADDVADPIGLSNEVYERTAKELADLVDRLVELGWRETRG